MTEDEKKAVENPLLEGGWSVPRGYYSKLKYYGINIQKGFISFASFMTSLQLQNRVFPHEQNFPIHIICHFVQYIGYLFTLTYQNRRDQCQCNLVFLNTPKENI